MEEKQIGLYLLPKIRFELYNDKLNYLDREEIIPLDNSDLPEELINSLDTKGYALYDTLNDEAAQEIAKKKKKN